MNNNLDLYDGIELPDDDDSPVTPLDISQPPAPTSTDGEEESPTVTDAFPPLDEIPMPTEATVPPKAKSTRAKKSAGAKKSTAKDKKTDASEDKPEEKPFEKSKKGTLACSVLFWILSFLTAVFLFANIWSDAGPLIKSYSTLLYGLFGWGALFTVPLFLLFGFEWKKYVAEDRTLSKVLTACGFTVLLSAFFHVIMIMAGGIEEPTFRDVFRLSSYWYTDRTIVGGGVFGGLIGGIFYTLMHGWVSLLILALLLLALALYYLRLTPKMIYDRLKASLEEKKKARAEKEAFLEVADEIRTPAPSSDAPTPITKIDLDVISTVLADEVGIKEMPAAPLSVTPPADTVPTSPAAPKEEAPALPRITVFSPDETDKPNDTDTLVYKFNHIPDTEDDDSTLNSTDYGYGVDDDDDFDLVPVTTIPKEETPDTLNTNTVTLPQNDLALTSDGALDQLDDLLDDTAEITDTDDGDGDDSLLIGGAPAQKPDTPPYVFPPIDLLTKGPATQNSVNREELIKTGQKLVDVLKSFRVETEIMNVSCGPTVTRYELAPKSGVRVRAISALVDDIALNLETSGVRIEAPIPGKAAVGVEVPNKEAATVYLRDLIESDAFRNAKSKLTACVGMDVSGAPILMDIAKMPHLLIAGATGMGKSVGVNSIIKSLLYKATPDELKLILIDPKKVELNMYNKLPHLLIPVVNNPKKAAGALATAVNEMERRFELIESVGARNLKGYNMLIENDPTKEKLPSIVIIIDELADLMMTAKDDVEDSICRIAQKARAAGIHLIICTQRPSVDVITGLIKANVPSRIAFTVASNIDSRTIIDVAGAEKLIGRGDMLFAPVGAMKPIRVQGSFVDDKEVEEVTNFIRNRSKDVTYDDSFLNQVEIAAEHCGQKKKAAAAASDEEIDASDELDPKFYEAVELAVDMGKLSTSLLQRKLSLGYGRAAKIIDSMEAMGIVGAPDGQKPRNVLISRQEFQEMMMKRQDTPPAT